MPDLEIRVSAEEPTPAAPPTTPPASAPSSTETIPALELGRVMEAVERMETTLNEVKGTAESARNMAQAALDRPATIVETIPEAETETEVSRVPVTLESESVPAAPPAKKRSAFAKMFLGA